MQNPLGFSDNGGYVNIDACKLSANRYEIPYLNN